MLWICVGLAGVSCAIGLALTWLVMRAGVRLGTFDSAGVPGQVKAPPRRVPNTGGIAIFWAMALPILAGIAAVWAGDGRLIGWLAPAAEEHLPGLREQTPLALALVGSLALLHVLGLRDDRRPMGPWIKLAIMAAPAVAIPVLFPSTRLLTVLDTAAGGAWASIAVTSLWFIVVTNAMNFMDNMDGLSGGVALIAGSLFMVAALLQGQWFVAGTLALLVGACAGFLRFNFPWRRPARIFMGDGGSLVLGFTLAFLTVRTTYLPVAETGAPSPAWHAVLMPLVVLAVPLYDFVSVVAIRLSQGRSPFVGDLQHLSHRLTYLGLSRRAAVVVILGLTAVTGITGILLSTLRPWQAVLAGVQVGLVLAVLAVFECARASRAMAEDRGAPPGDGHG